MTLLAGAMSPGPSVALVLRTAITHGRSSALAVALAHGVGISVYALAVVLGLAALIQNSVFFMNALQISEAFPPLSGLSDAIWRYYDADRRQQGRCGC